MIARVLWLLDNHIFHCHWRRLCDLNERMITGGEHG